LEFVKGFCEKIVISWGFLGSVLGFCELRFSGRQAGQPIPLAKPQFESFSQKTVMKKAETY
jgi:hypothetical protein